MNQLRKYGTSLVLIVSLIGFFSLPRLIEGFTPVESICQKCLQKSKYEYRIGATCNDGWQSSATGRGACSHHGGVRQWKYHESYKKTHSECMEFAKERSWRKK